MANGVRRITNSGSKKIIGKFPSLKMDTIIWWESQIERDYIYLLEIDPTVQSYRGQPFKITYISKGVTKNYTPDFWVQRIGQQQVIEVKPASQVNDQKNLDKWRHISHLCEERSMRFMVVTDTMIRQQPKLDNIKLLYKYARSPLTLQQYLDCQCYFTSREPTPFKQVCHDLERKGIYPNLLFKLLYFGWLSTDLMESIGAASLIQLSQFKGDVQALLLDV
ncbi:TnsA endonuclease (plasmid) [Nostoc sp. 'Peltigera membranacea cyanobiont' N6]|nr:TnsA endonuclease [Nostoc sp. 'Peltigera membranacea cyanobiont' N6]MBG1270537.1 transposase [Nostoc sp. WHI]